MNIKMIGAGNIFSKESSACYLVDDKVLVDVPNGTLKSVLRHGYDISKLECILITHFHGDHFFDLPFILLSLFDKRKDLNLPKLYIICDNDQKHKIKEILDLSSFNSFDIFCDTLNIKILGIDEKENYFKISDKYAIESISVEHMKGAYGYILTDVIKNQKVGFTGDSRLCDGVEKIIEKSDISFCDMSNIIGDKKAHMGIDDIKYLLSKNTNKRIVSSHMKEDTKKEALKSNIHNLIVGKDGLEINI